MTWCLEAPSVLTFTRTSFSCGGSVNYAPSSPQQRPHFTADASVCRRLCPQGFCLLVLFGGERADITLFLTQPSWEDRFNLSRRVTMSLLLSYPDSYMCTVWSWPVPFSCSGHSAPSLPPPLVPFPATESHSPEPADKALTMGETLVYRTPFLLCSPRIKPNRGFSSVPRPHHRLQVNLAAESLPPNLCDDVSSSEGLETMCSVLEQGSRSVLLCS